MFVRTGKKKAVCAQSLSHIQIFVTPQAVACQAPLSMGFSRQEYWSRLPIPTPGDLPNPGIKPVSLASPALVDWFFTTAAPEKPEAKSELVQFLARRLSRGKEKRIKGWSG